VVPAQLVFCRPAACPAAPHAAAPHPAFASGRGDDAPTCTRLVDGLRRPLVPPQGGFAPPPVAGIGVVNINAAMAPAPVMYVGPYKSKGVAALFAFLFCGWGIHHFYLRNAGAGVAQLCLLFFGVLLSAVFIGIPMLMGALIWSFIDGINIISGNVTDSRGQPLV